MFRVGLKAAIVARGVTQREFARLAQVAENRLSDLIRCSADPTAAERSQFSQLLNQPADALFATDVRIELRSAR